MAYYLGVDIGTSSTKSILIDEAGQILAEASVAYPVHMPKPQWTEQDPEDWWQATIQTIRQVVKKSKVKGAEVKGIGLSGQMHGSVFLDGKGAVIRKALLWNDQRTGAECEEITRRAGGRAKLIQMVGNPALTGFTAPKILWLRNHEPKHFDRLRKVLLPKDEIRRRLTGEFATDASDASGMLLLNVAQRNWSKPLLTKLELDADLFAPVFESEQVTGQLTPAVAKLLGLSTECKVVGGAGDCAAGAVGNGVVKSGIVTTSLGTSGVVFVHADQPQYDAQGRLHTFCHAVHGKCHMMGVTLSAAGSFQWFVEQVMAHQPREASKLYASLFEAAGKVPCGSQGLFFLPYLAGERTPHADPNARGCWIGLTSSHTRNHMARAVMEGVAYSLKESLEIIRELGIPIREIRASGGGARNPVWKQILANSFEHKIATINAEQGPAFGVALLAAVGDGAYRSIEEACGATIKVVESTPVQKREAKYYQQAFPVYRRLYGALAESFSSIHALEERFSS